MQTYPKVRQHASMLVEPKGIENDPNVTTRKFTGTRHVSYRSRMHLKVVGEMKLGKLTSTTGICSELIRRALTRAFVAR